MSLPKSNLTPEEIAFFHREGYLVIDRLLEESELAFAREVYDRIFEARTGREEGNEFDLAGADEDEKPAALPQILSPARYAPEFETLKARDRALAITRQLLGEDAFFSGDHAILKPAGYGAETPWHQDEAYWDEASHYNAVSVWIPFQEATQENGCLHFIPGSHLWELKPHHPIGNDPRVHGLEVDQVDPSGAVVCPLKAGGATIHHSRTMHYAGPNRTQGVRRAYIMVFQTPARKLEQPHDFYWWKSRTTTREKRAQAYKEKQG